MLKSSAVKLYEEEIVWIALGMEQELMAST